MTKSIYDLHGKEYIPFYGEEKYIDRINYHIKLEGIPDRRTTEYREYETLTRKSLNYHTKAKAASITAGIIIVLKGLEALLS